MAGGQIKALNHPEKPLKQVLFVGYDRTQTSVIDALIKHGCQVFHTEEKFSADDGQWDLIISFGYRHIFKPVLLDSLPCPIINLHIAYLPFNRGAHPNFWSFYDNTPAGVTIHLIDQGIDTGPILYQKAVDFEPQDQTFRQTYGRLVTQIELLFIANLNEIVSGNWTAKPQKGEGTLHYVKDLPSAFGGWDTLICEEITRLKTMSEKQ